MVKPLSEVGNTNDLSIYVWFIHSQVNNFKKIQKYNSKCTEFIRKNKTGHMNSKIMLTSINNPNKW